LAYLLRGLELALLSPIALIGLLIELLRSLFVKAKRKIKRQGSSPALFTALSEPNLSEDKVAPFLVAIRLTDFLIRVHHAQDLSQSDISARKRQQLDESLSQWSTPHSQEQATPPKVHRRHGINELLEYLREIRAKVYVFEEDGAG
jgi:hypothetical protein